MRFGLLKLREGSNRTPRRAARATGSLLFFISIFLLPWWVTLLLGVFLLVVFESYEVVLGGAVIDLLYGAPVPFFGGVSFLATAVFLILSVGVFFLRRRLLI